MSAETIAYPGKDLEAMHFAVNYHRWILEIVQPYLGSNIVEVGAGTGSFSEMLLEFEPRSLVLIEPSEMYHLLSERFDEHPLREVVTLLNKTFTQAVSEKRMSSSPDSIIYVNVLEHIEDDSAELETAYEVLRPGGRLVVFVPAFPRLFSEFDKKIGHYRRYRMKGLKGKLEKVGFQIELARWFDCLGTLPWLVKYKLLRSRRMETGAVTAYDQLAVPILKRLESLIHPPIGKNILLVAAKV